MSAGILTRGGDWITWIRELVHHQAEIAALRKSENGDLDIIAEGARLKKMQADRIEIQIKTQRREVAHVEPLVLAISSVFAVLKSRILALPHRLRALNLVSTAGYKAISDDIHNFLADLSITRIDPALMARINEQEAANWEKGDDENSKSGTNASAETNDRRAVSKVPRGERKAASKKTRRPSKANSTKSFSGAEQNMEAVQAAGTTAQEDALTAWQPPRRASF